MSGASHKQGRHWLREDATLAGLRGSLQEHNVNGEVWKHDENEFASNLVGRIAIGLGTNDHASITDGGDPCRQQQQPDGHASSWTERPSEAAKKKFLYVSFTSWSNVTVSKGLSKNVHCSSSSSIHILYNHAPSGGVGPPPGRCTRLEMFQ